MKVLARRLRHEQLRHVWTVRKPYNKEDTMKRPIGVLEAANMAGVSPDRISAAMSEGRLAWKRLRGQRATTEGWVKEWLNG
jgi:hypothetical protein